MFLITRILVHIAARHNVKEMIPLIKQTYPNIQNKEMKKMKEALMLNAKSLIYSELINRRVQRIIDERT